MTATKRKASSLDPRAQAQRKLDRIGIEAFCDRIAEGENYRSIARSLDVGVAAICRWLEADVERSARAKSARVASAQSFDDMAEEILVDPAHPPEIRRELASHYRWRAKMVNPREYGDKLQVDQTTRYENLPDDAIAARMAAIKKQMEDGQGATGEAQHEGGT